MNTKITGLLLNVAVASSCATTISLSQCMLGPDAGLLDAQAKGEPHPHPAQNHAAQQHAAQAHQQQQRQQQQHAAQAHQQQQRQQQQRAAQAHQQQERQQQQRAAQGRQQQEHQQQQRAAQEHQQQERQQQQRVGQEHQQEERQQQQRVGQEHQQERQQQQRAAQEHEQQQQQQQQRAAQEHQQERRQQEQVGQERQEQRQRQEGASQNNRQAQERGGESFQQQHPARAEVLGRDNNLNRDINEDKGDLSHQYYGLKREDNSIRRQEQNDAARNGGHLTGQEDRQLNREENNLGRQISRDNQGAGDPQFQKNHPARSEVLGRDSNLNRDLNQDKGDLSGHYYGLKREDNSIRRQEQIDAAKNGGHLTGQEDRQLNGEENNLGRQISRDNQGAGDPQFQKNHPARSEVLGRDSNLNRDLNQDKGDLSGHYYGLKKEDNSIRRQEQIDAAKNGGHLTGQEDRQLNGEENNLGRQISRDNQGPGDAQFQKNHPARSEVLGRDSNLNRDLNQDKGDLSGHYYGLKKEDNSIRRQEQIDAAKNGGHLTGQEDRQLNGEENNLGRQISRDNQGPGDAQFQKNHPARSEVLGRDSNLNRDLNEDKGDLSGHYYGLKKEDNSIRRQEQIDAAKNGGHLTGQEDRQLNGEENNLGRQISRDNQGPGDAQFQKNHPGRSEVLGRDGNLNRDINQDKGSLGGQYGQLKSEDNSIRRQEQIDAARNGGHLTGQEYSHLNREENNLARQITQDHRPINPPPIHQPPAPFPQASPSPFLQGNISAAQRGQALLAYQNMQNNITPVQQPPGNFQQCANAGTGAFMNNYPCSVGGQPLNINSGNTYVNNVPQSGYPGWWGGGGGGGGFGGGGGGFGGGGGWQPGPGWGWSNGFVLGSQISAGLPWLRWGWPSYCGPAPAGFIHAPGYFPTPWIYNQLSGQWRQPGLPGWAPGPPPADYAMPISVQAIEPIEVVAQGFPRTINQIVMYNAFYNPQFGRWGYRNRSGYFVWLNTGVPS